jgi:16S rRNA (guanine1207-N2)-methyltransferase
MSHPANAVLQRHLETLQESACLLIQPPDTELAASLPKATLFSDDWVVTEQSEQVEFGRFPTLNADCPRAIVFCPRERERQEALFSSLADQASADQEIWLVGPLKGGIKPAAKRLEVYFDNVYKLDAARHCAIFVAREPKEGRPHFNDQQSKTQYEIAGQALTLCSYPGVFGHDKVDEGTELLLNHLPSFAGKGLDIGCGDGIITSWLMLQNEGLEMKALDSNAHALAATQATLQANDLSAAIEAVNVYPAKPKSVAERYQFIVSNPPFHRGVDTSYRAAERLIAEARDHLVAGGQLWIVANAHLAYQPLLESSMGRTQLIAETNKFKVWRAYRQSN